MSRPIWCPHSDCVWLTGGGASEDSGVVCGGELPKSEDHLGTANTHRFCIRTADDDIADYQTNQSDLWYMIRVLTALRAKAMTPEREGNLTQSAEDNVSQGEQL